MAPASRHPGTRQIGWNGIRLALLDSWEAVVGGPCHLLIDHDLSPLVEIRWQPAGSAPAKDLPTLLRQAAGGPGALRPSSPPAPFAHLPFDELTGLTAPENSGPEGLCWRCRECGTLFLVLLHAGGQPVEQQLVDLLGSLTCHRDPSEPDLWAVQDFRLLLPPGYTFIDSTFKAGLSRLAFSGNGHRLAFCRLAPAGARLARSTMAELLQTMMGSSGPLERLLEGPLSCEYQRRVSAVRQLAGRLLARQPFCWGRIWHDRDHDRLLALVVDSRRPIDPEKAATLCKNYEIVRQTQ